MKNKSLAYRIAYYATYATFVLTAAFIVLRLIGVIAWSWWWVFAPVLLPFGVVFLLVILALVVLGKYSK